MCFCLEIAGRGLTVGAVVNTDGDERVFEESMPEADMSLYGGVLTKWLEDHKHLRLCVSWPS